MKVATKADTKNASGFLSTPKFHNMPCDAKVAKTNRAVLGIRFIRDCELKVFTQVIISILHQSIAICTCIDTNSHNA